MFGSASYTILTAAEAEPSFIIRNVKCINVEDSIIFCDQKHLDLRRDSEKLILEHFHALKECFSFLKHQNEETGSVCCLAAVIFIYTDFTVTYIFKGSRSVVLI